MSANVLWAIVAGVLTGVFVRSFVPLTFVDASFVLFIGAAAALFIFVDRAKSKQLIVVAVACVAFAGGIIRMESVVQTGDSHLSERINSTVTIEGFVSSEPDVRDNSVRLTVDTSALIASSTTLIHGKILVVAPAHTSIRYGDEVRATGTLELPRSFDTSDGRQFDYPMYLAKDGILYELSFAQILRTGTNNGNPVQAAAINVKRTYLAGLDSVLPEPEGGLAGGITVGDKRSVGTELSNIFQRDSLIHMIVLSGYNITVVINAVRWMLQFLPRLAQYAGIFSAVSFFILMAGGAASAVRSGAMALIAVYARASGRVFHATRILGVVALGMVLWNPYTLCFDPSFQLSALATLGLVLLTPIFVQWCGWVPEKYGLREIVSSTLATQLMVLPFLLYQNGNLSVVALPANLLALIPVPLAMLLSFFAAVGGMISQVVPVFNIIAVLLAFPAYLVLAYIIGVARLLAALPFASVSISSFSAWWMFAAYAVVFVGIVYIQKTERGP